MEKEEIATLAVKEERKRSIEFLQLQIKKRNEDKEALMDIIPSLAHYLELGSAERLKLVQETKKIMVAIDKLDRDIALLNALITIGWK